MTIPPMSSDTREAGRIYDKNGRQIMLGDIVKVYHFMAALRRKRHYMYKQAVRIRTFKDGSHAMFFSHLDMTEDGYHQMLDGKHLADYEIVQSVCARFEERPRATPTSNIKDNPDGN